MNIETVRSLTDFIDSVTDLVASKGERKDSFKKAKFSMQSAIATEQDLRDADFMNAVLKLYATEHAPEVKTPVSQASHQSQQVPHQSQQVSHQGQAPQPSQAPEVKKPVPVQMPPAKSPTADLTVKKSGLA